MNLKNIFIPIAVILLAGAGVLVYKVSKPSEDFVSNNQNQIESGNRLGLNQENGTGPQRGTGTSSGQTQSKGNCLSDGCLAINDLNYPVGELSEDAKTALSKALDDEYKAYATYDAVIKKLGSVRPFIMILRAEEQHISSLKAIYDKYGVSIPENSYTGNISSPETLEEACSIGVEAEIANASLYRDELLSKVTDYEDITLVFNNLMDASQLKHLPAFQRCAE